MQRISDYELEPMKIIWGNGDQALYVETVEGPEVRGEPWAKSTAITLLSRPVKKGLLKPNKIGWKNEYVAVMMEEDYWTAQMETSFHKLYQEDAKGPMCMLAEKEMLSPEDYGELRQFWEGRGVSCD